MQAELDRVSGAYRELQAKLRSGAEQFVPGVKPAAQTTSAQGLVPVAAPVNVVALKPVHNVVTSQTDGPEWSARLAGSWSGTGGGPSLASAAACPLPEYGVLEAPKDYPAPRRSGGFDEHSYA